MINTEGFTVEEALRRRCKELSIVVYGAIGAKDIKNRLLYAEYLRNEADAISFAAAKIIGDLKRQIEQIEQEGITDNELS